MTQEVTKESPRCLDGQQPGRTMGRVSGVTRTNVTHHTTCQRTGLLDRSQASLHAKQYDTDLHLTRQISPTDYFHFVGLHIPKPSQENQDYTGFPN